MRLKILSMTGGQVDQAEFVVCETSEANWLSAYEAVTTALLDSGSLCLQHMVLLPQSGQGSIPPRRAVWHLKDHPVLMDRLGGPGACEGVDAERYLVLSPPKAIPTRPVTELVVGSLAMDLAEILTDIPEDHGYDHDGDAVLAMRAVIAAIVVGAARRMGLVANPAAASLAAQIRRDFAAGLLDRYRNVEFNRCRVASDASPGLATAVGTMIAEAIAMPDIALPLNEDDLFEVAADLLRSHAPKLQDA